MSSKWFPLSPVLALGAGWGLRVYHLGAQGLWGDEAFSVYVAKLPLLQALAPGLDTHPPLYYGLLNLWLREFGAQVFPLRYLSACLSLLTISLAYVAGAWLFHPRVGTVAAWLMSVAPLQVIYAQELRMYAAVGLFALASTVCLIALLRGHRSSGWWLGYGIAVLLGIYTHYQMFYLLPTHAVVVLIAWWPRRHGRWRRTPLWAWVGAMLVLALAYLPWMVGEIPRLLADPGRHDWRLPSAGELWMIAERGLSSYAGGLTLPQDQELALIIWLAFAVAGVIVAVRRRPTWVALLLGLGTLSPLVVAWIVNPAMPSFNERFVLVGSAALLLAVAAGIEALWRHQRAVAGLALVAVVALQGVALDHWYADPQYIKSDFGATMAALAAQARPGDLLLLNEAEQQPLLEYYKPAGIAQATIPGSDALSREKTLAYLSRTAKGFDRVWLISYGDRSREVDRDAVEWLDAHGWRIDWQPHRGFELSLYVLLSTPLAQAPTIPLLVNFADGIQLNGAAVQPPLAQAGRTLLVTLFWTATARPAVAYTVFVHLLDSQGRLVAQSDSQPGGGRMPTNSWKPGQTVIDRRAISLPAWVGSGKLVVRVGLYTWPDLTRLSVVAASQPVDNRSVEVGGLEVR